MPQVFSSCSLVMSARSSGEHTSFPGIGPKAGLLSAMITYLIIDESASAVNDEEL